MLKRAGAIVEIDSRDEFDTLLAAGVRSMRGWRVQDVDLSERTDQLLRLDPAGSVFLGCELDAIAMKHLQDGGGLVFPDLPELPFDAYRTTLYSPSELYAGIDRAPYRKTPDAVIYAWSCRRDGDVSHRMAAALHDHAIDNALDAELAGARVVGVMGGHGIQRDGDGYLDAARLGYRLARAGLRLTTGGGPGAMEAANLGAYLGRYDEGAVTAAVQMLSSEPGTGASITRWARAALAVRTRWPDATPSAGIPTWFYGHEPPNLFATGIAKYFQNSLREDTLLRHCDAGVIFLPGVAGTVQEIFQDACDNYYAEAPALTPMVLVGKRYWSGQLPVWQLVTSLAAGRPMARAVHLVDTVEDAVALVEGGLRGVSKPGRP